MWRYHGFLIFSWGWLVCLVSSVVLPWTAEKVINLTTANMAANKLPRKLDALT